MNLQRLNNFLTNGMIGVFASIFPLSILTLLFPIFGYVVAFALVLLAAITAINFVATTIALVIQINEMVSNFFKYYESESTTEG